MQEGKPIPSKTGSSTDLGFDVEKYKNAVKEIAEHLKDHPNLVTLKDRNCTITASPEQIARWRNELRNNLENINQPSDNTLTLPLDQLVAFERHSQEFF